MRNVVSTCVDRIRSERKARIRLASVLLLLSVVITVGVFWRLHYTGIAMVNETYCGYAEHQHDNSCYAQVLSCGLEEGGENTHTHDDSCYETLRTLVCGLEESEGHSHGGECLDADGNIICGLEESAGHVHDESCYAAEQVLSCGLTESDIGHVHTESCYATVLTCELPEHVHSTMCMSNGNADTETAGDWEATLPDEISDIRAEAVVAIARSQIGYTESEANFHVADDGVTRKGYTRYGAWYGSPYGDWDAMFVSFCLSYAGVPEEEFPETAGVYAWVTELKRMESEDCEDGTGELNLYMDAGNYIPVAGDIIFFDEDGDERADHVGIVEEIETETDDRTGEVAVTAIKTVEGDCNNAVRENEYRPEDETIVGYGILPENPDAEEEISESAVENRVDIEYVSYESSTETWNAADGHAPTDVVPEEGNSDAGEEVSEDPEASDEIYENEAGEMETITYTAGDGGVEVEVVLPKNALPEGTVLSVTLYDEEDSEYIEALSLLEDAENAEVVTTYDTEPEDDGSFVIAVDGVNEDFEEKSGMAVLDISFLLEGEVVEPTESAQVSIDYSALLPDDTDPSILQVTHLEETETGTDSVLVADSSDEEEEAVDFEEGTVEFSVDSFSGFVLYWSNNDGRWSVRIHCTLAGNYGSTTENGHAEIDGFECDYEIVADYDGGTTVYIDDILASLTIPEGYYFAFATVSDRNYDHEFGTRENSAAAVVTVPVAGASNGRQNFYTYNADGEQITYYGSSGGLNESGYFVSTVSSENAHYNINLYFEEVTKTEEKKQTHYNWTYDQNESGESYNWTVEIDCYEASQFNVPEGERVQLEDMHFEYQLEPNPDGTVSINIQDIVDSISVSDGYYYVYSTVADRYYNHEFGSQGDPAAYLNTEIDSSHQQVFTVENSDGNTLTGEPIDGGSSVESSYAASGGYIRILLYFETVERNYIPESNCTQYIWHYGDNTWTLEIDCYDVEKFGNIGGEGNASNRLSGIECNYQLIPNPDGSITVYVQDIYYSLSTEEQYILSFASVSNRTNAYEYGTEDNPAAFITGKVVNNTNQRVTTYNAENEVITVNSGSSSSQYFDTSSGGKFHINLYLDEGVYEGVIFNTANKTATGGAYNSAGRVAEGGLDQYADNYGRLEIFLPTNDDVINGKKFVICKDQNGQDVKSANAMQKFANYDWKLVGWYNIATGEYYSVSDGEQTSVVINLGERNVFYADYIPSGYNFGDPDDEALLDTVSTSDFVTIQMFDYNELFNLYSSILVSSYNESNSFTNSTFDEKWTDSGDFYNTPTYIGINRNSGQNSSCLGSSFVFFGTTQGTEGALVYPSGARNHQGGGGTAFKPASTWDFTSPVLDKDTNPILWSLFSPDSDKLGVTYVGAADYLFQFGGEGAAGADGEDFEGYYYYTSKLNSAAYNQSAGRFYVYDRNEYYNNSGNVLSMFAPYNYFDDETTHAAGEYDYWFGMSVEIQFYLPYDVGTEDEPSDNTYLGNDMTFYFSGDDDVFVFIDGELILDLGGVHMEAQGHIDFAKGTWERYILGNSGNKNSVKNGTLDLKAGDHTMVIYYLERGGSASNLTISFNIIPEWIYESDNVTTVTAEKEWSDSESGTDHSSDEVQMGLFEYVTDYTAITDEHDEDKIIGYTIGNKSYYYADDETGSQYNYSFCFEENNGDGIVWYNEAVDRLYILSDPPGGQENPVTVSSENDWTHTWEQLDENISYIVLEMSVYKNYISSVSSERRTENHYTYWSIVGETELEDYFRDHDSTVGTTMEVILTDAGLYGGEGTNGMVVNHELSVNKNIEFSMRPETVSAGEGDNRDGSKVKTIYGVVGDSQISDDLVWTLTYTDDTGSEIFGSITVIRTFTLSFIRDGVAFYLAVDEVGTGLELVTDSENASEFYVDDAGEVRVHVEGVDESKSDDSHRVTIDENGNLSVMGTESSLQDDNLRIYTLTEGHTTLYDFTILNTRLTDLILKKISSKNAEVTLAGAQFTLTKEVDVLDDYGESTGESETWYYDGENGTWTKDITAVTTDEDGIVKISGLEPGIYTVTEVLAPDGYMLSDEGAFTISVSDQGTLIIVENELVFANVEYDDEENIVLDLAESAEVNFTLTKEIEILDKYNEPTGEKGTFYYDSSDGTWGEEERVITTDENGQVILGGLESGSYTITHVSSPDEEEIPDGGPFTLTVSDDGVSLEKADKLKYSSVQVDDDGNIFLVEKDVPRADLPSTGGTGTILFTAAGILLVCASAILIYMKKKRVDEK